MWENPPTQSLWTTRGLRFILLMIGMTGAIEAVW